MALAQRYYYEKERKERKIFNLLFLIDHNYGNAINIDEQTSHFVMTDSKNDRFKKMLKFRTLLSRLLECKRARVAI